MGIDIWMDTTTFTLYGRNSAADSWVDYGHLWLLRSPASSTHTKSGVGVALSNLREKFVEENNVFESYACFITYVSSVWKSLKMSHLNFVYPVFFEFRAKMDKTDDYMERELKYSHFCKMRLFFIIFYTLLWDEIIVKSRIAWEFV